MELHRKLRGGVLELTLRTPFAIEAEAGDRDRHRRHDGRQDEIPRLKIRRSLRQDHERAPGGHGEAGAGELQCVAHGDAPLDLAETRRPPLGEQLRRPWEVVLRLHITSLEDTRAGSAPPPLCPTVEAFAAPTPRGFAEARGPHD